jgi:hypothetical protein
MDTRAMDIKSTEFTKCAANTMLFNPTNQWLMLECANKAISPSNDSANG